MELKLHKKKDNDTRRQYFLFIDYRFYSFSDLSFISYTNSLFPIQIVILVLVHLLWSA